MITRRSSIGLAFAAKLALPEGAHGQSARLSYQKRTGYSEGTRTERSTGPTTLDLIAALVDHREPSTKLPPKFQARFYVPGSERPSLWVREIEPLYFYQLGDVDSSSWAGPRIVAFEWPTEEVVRYLNYRSERLELGRLGAVVRLGYTDPRSEETIAPVALCHTQPPSDVTSYRFVFLPSQRSHLEFRMYPERSKTEMAREIFDSTAAGKSQAFYWDCGLAANGWYELRVTGWALSNNAPVNSVVRFYHRRKLQ